MIRRCLVSILTTSGFGLILLGLTVLSSGHISYAQDTPQADAEYIGEGDCSDCHRGIGRLHEESAHALALQDTSDDDDKNLILGDFSSGGDVLTIAFPGESEPRTLTPDDIVFAIGSGRNKQQYLYETDENTFAVLPVIWNTVSQTWEIYGDAKTWPNDPAYDWALNCAGCHTTGYAAEDNEWEDDGVQCEACHGPGSAHADAADDAGGDINEDEMREIRSAITLSPDAQICGQCHSRGVESGGGHAFPVVYLPGEMLVDEEVFQLAANDDSDYWWPTAHAKQSNMQFNEWLNSAHARSLDTMKGATAASDDCLQCHSADYSFTQNIIALHESGDREGEPPDPATLDTVRFGITCTSCHRPHSETTVDFDLIAEPYTLCISCHQNTEVTETIHHPVREMFEGIALVSGIEGIPSKHFTAEDGPECTTCHMADVPVGSSLRASHLFTPILPDESSELPSACAACHEDLTATDLRLLVTEMQDDVRTRLSVARARLVNVAAPDSGTEARVLYDRVAAALDFVQNEGGLGIHNYPYADTLLDSAEQTLSNLSVPGATIEPTEAPAPTATPSEEQTVIASAAEVRGGFRPVTLVLLMVVALVLLIAAVMFFRSPANPKV